MRIVAGIIFVAGLARAGFGDVILVPQDYATIQEAIDAARQLDTVIVSPGRYAERIHFRGKLITVRSVDPDDPAVVAATILDGEQGGSVVTFSGVEDGRAALDGITVTGGDAAEGGGIAGHASRATLSRCVITRNNASWAGGGVHGFGGVMIECDITSNTSMRYGGGVFGGDGVVMRSWLAGNTAGDSGGGIRDFTGHILDSVISGNNANYGGGMSGCDGLIGGNTISGNYAQFDGGGAYGCRGVLTGCVFWDNRPDQLELSNAATYSDVQGGGGGEGSIDENPLFVLPGYWDAGVWMDGDYRLLESSPCVDAGDPDYEGGEDERDRGGNRRMVNGRVDMGAYEYQFFDCGADFDGDGTEDCFDEDIDNDGVLNGGDACDFTPQSVRVDENGRPLGDVDGDCDGDLEDHALAQQGFTGPLLP